MVRGCACPTVNMKDFLIRHALFFFTSLVSSLHDISASSFTLCLTFQLKMRIRNEALRPSLAPDVVEAFEGEEAFWPLIDLMRAAWDHLPAQRPSAVEVCHALAHLLGRRVVLHHRRGTVDCRSAH